MYAHRRILTYFGVVFGQYLAVMYGTYAVFSWDIMEPLTCGMTLADAFIAYCFWVWTKQNYDLGGIKQHYYQRGVP